MAAADARDETAQLRAGITAAVHAILRRWESESYDARDGLVQFYEGCAALLQQFPNADLNNCLPSPAPQQLGLLDLVAAPLARLRPWSKNRELDSKIIDLAVGVFRTMFSRGADPNEVMPGGRTVFGKVLQNMNVPLLSVVEVFLENGADPDLTHDVEIQEICRSARELVEQALMRARQRLGQDNRHLADLSATVEMIPFYERVLDLFDPGRSVKAARSPVTR